MADEAAERSERATPKRREEARKRGQVPISSEVSPVAVLLVALVITTWGAPALLAQTRLVLRGWLAASGPAAAHGDAIWPMVAHSMYQLLGPLAPFFLATALVAAVAIIAQVGFHVNPSLLAPKLSRMSLAQGWQRVFSVGGAMNLLKAIVKIVLVLGLAWHILRDVSADAVAAPLMSVDALFAFTGEGLRRLILTMALALAALGAADYFWQRRRHEQSLKMSRQEVKEEARESEGDPQVRARFRRAHRELAGRRMLAEVKNADVVLTNPTHYAIALRYRADEMVAPQVIAKGAGELAQKIKEAARSAGVPIVERRALARALYRSVKVGAEIPPALYRAVAEILAYIYSLRSAQTEGAR
jgi:flagellar biosynthetic protein FlhB